MLVIWKRLNDIERGTQIGSYSMESAALKIDVACEDGISVMVDIESLEGSRTSFLADRENGEREARVNFDLVG